MKSNQYQSIDEMKSSQFDGMHFFRRCKFYVEHIQHIVPRNVNPPPRNTGMHEI